MKLTWKRQVFPFLINGVFITFLQDQNVHTHVLHYGIEKFDSLKGKKWNEMSISLDIYKRKVMYRIDLDAGM